MLKSFQNKSAINVRPTRLSAVAEGPAADPRAARQPEAIRAEIERHFAETEKPIQQKLDRETAQLKLAKFDFDRRELEVKAMGGDPVKDETWRNGQRLVEALEEQVAATTAQIAARRERAKEIAAMAPELLARYVKQAGATMAAFNAVKPLFDDLAATAKEIETALFDSDPTTGQQRLVGVRLRSGSVLSVFKQLEPIFGLDRHTGDGRGSWLMRMLREAAELGIEVR